MPCTGAKFPEPMIGHVAERRSKSLDEDEPQHFVAISWFEEHLKAARREALVEPNAELHLLRGERDRLRKEMDDLFDSREQAELRAEAAEKKLKQLQTELARCT